MNRFNVRKVAVLGAGVMGAQIAAHLVNAKVPAILFDLPAKEGPKNGIVTKAVEGLKKLKPSPIGAAEDLSLIQQANYEEHLALLAGCDLVIEAIVERLDIKRAFFAELENLVQPSAVLATSSKPSPSQNARRPARKLASPPGAGRASGSPRIQRASAASQTRTAAARHHHTEKPNRKYPMSANQAPNRPPKLCTVALAPEVDQAGSRFEWLSRDRLQKASTTRPRTRPPSWANREAPVGGEAAPRTSGVLRVCKE